MTNFISDNKLLPDQEKIIFFLTKDASISNKSGLHLDIGANLTYLIPHLNYSYIGLTLSRKKTKVLRQQDVESYFINLDETDIEKQLTQVIDTENIRSISFCISQDEKPSDYYYLLKSVAELDCKHKASIITYYPKNPLIFFESKVIFCNQITKEKNHNTYETDILSYHNAIMDDLLKTLNYQMLERFDNQQNDNFIQILGPKLEQKTLIEPKQNFQKSKRPFLSLILPITILSLNNLKDTLLSLAVQEDRDFEVLILVPEITKQQSQDLNTLLNYQPAWLKDKCTLIESKEIDLYLAFQKAQGYYINIIDEDIVLSAPFVKILKSLAIYNFGTVLKLSGLAIEAELIKISETETTGRILKNKALIKRNCQTKDYLPLHLSAFPHFAIDLKEASKGNYLEMIVQACDIVHSPQIGSMLFHYSKEEYDE